MVNATLANLKRECRTYLNRAKYNNSESSRNLYHTKLSLHKKEIRISKRRAWANFCSSIESAAEASRLRRILVKSPATIGYLKTNADSWTENSQEILELLLDTHFPKNTHEVGKTSLMFVCRCVCLSPAQLNCKRFAGVNLWILSLCF